jgi:hypothetical protein
MRTFIGYIILVFLFISGCSTRESGSNQEYIHIPGTPVRLIPPEEFTLAPDIGGFKHTRLTASIMVLQSPLDFKTIASGFTAQALTKQGGELLSTIPVTIDSTEAMLYKTFRISQGLNFVQWSLVFPLNGHAITVMSAYLKENDRELSDKIKNALITTRVAKEDIADQRALSFTIDAKPLKLAQLLQGPSLMFTREGKWNEQEIFDLSFFAGPSMDNGYIEQSEDFALGQLKDVCADCQVDKNGIQKISIDSLNGYEIVSYRNDSAAHVKRLKYEVMLFDGNKYYLLVGTASSDYLNNISVFRNISNSFKRKRG